MNSSHSDLPSKSQVFRNILFSPELAFIMEAHNALSARIVEKAGFCGIWASGLSISSALGLRDANEASWTQVVDIVEQMTDATQIPILVDGDSGFGNFNNVRQFVRKLDQRGAAGVCLEDKLFPKMNSFLGEKQALADIDEFSGRIKAAKDSQENKEFCVIARVEAFIAGYGIYEALKRAEAYYFAGADAILIHSKIKDASEIFSFMNEWAERCPVVIVPTKYYATPVSAYRNANISMVIWANHNIRASIAAMQSVCHHIQREESIAGIEHSVTSLNQLFSLLDYEELFEAEQRYLPEEKLLKRVS